MLGFRQKIGQLSRIELALACNARGEKRLATWLKSACKFGEEGQGLRRQNCREVRRNGSRNAEAGGGVVVCGHGVVFLWSDRAVVMDESVLQKVMYRTLANT